MIHMSIYIIDVLHEPMKLSDASSRGHAIEDMKWLHETGISSENQLTVIRGVNIKKGKVRVVEIKS